MLIPEQKVDEIKNKSDIVEVISESIDLKRSGSNFVGFSPFKDEKTPSFVVSPDKQIFKDFSSGKAGNVFSFLMEFHGMTFPEAASTLAEKYGVELGEVQEEDSEARRKALAYKAAEYASDRYYKYLMSKDGIDVYNYFAKRGFSKDLVEKFKLGYSPNQWDYILKTANKAGFNEQNLLDAGLIIKKDNNKTYDRFRDRAMFTIRDYIGRTVGFGGRILTNEKNQAKYINSPQSLIYDKSQVLYGLFEAKNSIRNKKEAILVEGYADVLALHEGGFENVVAASGTSLTTGQLKLLKRYASKLYFMLDADDAGINATEKGLVLALENKFDVKIVRLAAGEDPDSMLKKSGKKSIDISLRDAKDFIDFKIDRFKETEQLDTPQGLADAVRELVSIIKKVPDPLQHDFYISRIASAFNLSENQLKQVYREKDNSPDRKEQQQEIASKTSDRISHKIILDKILQEELILIKFILNDEENLHILLEKFEVSSDLLMTNTGRRMFELILKYSESKNVLDAILTDENANEQFKNIIAEIALSDEKPSENWNQFMREIESQGYEIAVSDALKSLKLKHIDRQLKELKNILKDNSDNKELLIKIKELNDEKVLLFNQKSSDIE